MDWSVAVSPVMSELLFLIANGDNYITAISEKSGKDSPTILVQLRKLKKLRYVSVSGDKAPKRIIYKIRYQSITNDLLDFIKSRIDLLRKMLVIKKAELSFEQIPPYFQILFEEYIVETQDSLKEKEIELEGWSSNSNSFGKLHIPIDEARKIIRRESIIENKFLHIFLEELMKQSYQLGASVTLNEMFKTLSSSNLEIAKVLVHNVEKKKINPPINERQELSQFYNLLNALDIFNGIDATFVVWASQETETKIMQRFSPKKS